MGRHARPSLMAGEMGLACASPPQAIDWEQEAASLTFYLDPGLLRTAAHDVVPGTTGELVWARRGGQAQSITLDVHPVLLVHAADESRQRDRCQRLLKKGPFRCSKNPHPLGYGAVGGSGFLSNPAFCFSRRRYDSPLMLITTL